MRRVQSAVVVPLAIVAAFAAGCSAGTDAADESANLDPTIAEEAFSLDGVAFEVRRDPG